MEQTKKKHEKTLKKWEKETKETRTETKRIKKDKKSKIPTPIDSDRCGKRPSYGFCDGLPLTVNPSLHLFSLASYYWGLCN
jgi:hypothetical protein